MHPYRTLYAKELVKYARSVYWINEPNRNPLKFLKRLFVKKGNTGGVKVYAPFLLTPTLFNLSAINALLLRIQLFFVCGFLNNKKTILWSVYCSHTKVIRHFQNTFKIYWPGDLFNPEKERNELGLYDMIMPLTEDKQGRLKGIYQGKTLLSQTGCDWELFERIYQQEKPFNQNTPPKAGRVIGYVGNLSAKRIDFKLIQSLANKLKDVTIELVGPIENDPDSQNWLKKLRLCPKIKFIGEISYAEVPQVISQFDVGIIPYILNEFNLGTNPNKFYEYSAMGVPCVSSNLPSLNKFLPNIRIGQDLESWSSLIKETLVENKERAEVLRKISFDASPQRALLKISNSILEPVN